MVLVSLELTEFRNLRHMSLLPAPGINIIWGRNGSGKTSVLEAIYLLACGRSFRSRRMDEIMTWKSTIMRLASKRKGGGALSLSKQRNRLPRFVLNGRAVATAAELVQTTPVELVYAGTTELVKGQPSVRRSFMDRGLFVMHLLSRQQRDYESAMRQRNRLLRQGADDDRLAPWEAIMASTGDDIDAARRTWLERYHMSLRALMEDSEHSWIQSVREELSLELDSGWPQGTELAVAMRTARERDRRIGYCTVGPHRADLNIRIQGQMVAEAASGGQRKLLTCFMVLAQGRLLATSQGHNSQNRTLYLLDDLVSELDARAVAAVLDLLARQPGQIFMTALTENELDGYWRTPTEVCKLPLEQLAETA